MRILITGSRTWSKFGVIEDAILGVAAGSSQQYKNVTIVHGDAPGADTLADMVARKWGMKIEAHPAEWDRLSKAAGPIRNQKMVDLGANICLAFPEPQSRGTRDCMRRASAAGILVMEFGRFL